MIQTHFVALKTTSYIGKAESKDIDWYWSTVVQNVNSQTDRAPGRQQRQNSREAKDQPNPEHVRQKPNV